MQGHTLSAEGAALASRFRASQARLEDALKEMRGTRAGPPPLPTLPY